MKAPLGLIVGNALAGIKFGQPSLDSGQEDQTLDRIVERGLWRQILKRLDDPVSFGLLRHPWNILAPAPQRPPAPRPAKPTAATNIAAMSCEAPDPIAASRRIVLRRRISWERRENIPV